MAYAFTNGWFANSQKIWERILPQYDVRRVVEIGSYEGRSACFLIETLAAKHPLELHCIDTWAGGVEHSGDDMGAVEARFHGNVAQARAQAAHAVDLHVDKSLSHPALARLVAAGRSGSFDLVYVDGSHQAPDVLADAVLAFMLLRKGGLMIFDDYLWSEHLPGGRDPLRMPKPAIDAFVNVNLRKLTVIGAPLYQLYVRKDAD